MVTKLNQLWESGAVGYDSVCFNARSLTIHKIVTYSYVRGARETAIESRSGHPRMVMITFPHARQSPYTHRCIQVPLRESHFPARCCWNAPHFFRSAPGILEQRCVLGFFHFSIHSLCNLPRWCVSWSGQPDDSELPGYDEFGLGHGYHYGLRR